MAHTDGLYPAFIKLYYEDALSPHTATLPCDSNESGDPLTLRPYLVLGNGAAIDAGIAVAAYVNVLKALAPTTATFQYWELWEIATPGADPTFRFTDDLNVPGTNASALVPASQVTWSYRTQGGGKGYVYLMSSAQQANIKGRGPAFISAPYKAVADYLVGDTCFIKGRDNTRPIVVTKVLTKTNDKMRKKLRIS